MRVAVLWTGLSGYMNACLKELASRDGVELFVSHRKPAKEAPFDEGEFAWIKNSLIWRSASDLNSLDQRLNTFAPEIMVVAGWDVPAYRRLARENSRKCWRVMTMDNCWRGTAKQRIGTWIAPIFLRPIADSVWLPGERQAVFAKKLGFQQQRILRGSYSCDQPAFEALFLARLAEGRPLPRSFLFVGRFVQEKGIDTLVKAYQLYRKATANPWPLVCCGAGPLQSRLEGNVGIRVDGFVQPERMPDVLASAGCLVLPSIFEPWGLVVHEATSAGALILASEQVGAVPHLVQPGYNGFIFGKRDAAGLAKLMWRLSAMSDARLDEMSLASQLLSKQFSPRRWVDTILESFYAPQQLAQAKSQGTQN
jgi:glycosyltransferase involved in cell wall biosynthesis